MINETKVTQSAVKAVKATGNKVKVTMYDNFAAGKEYFVVINGSDPMSFTIAGASAKDVDSIAIVTDTVVVNTAAPITVLLYNKDGVDITESVKAANEFNVTLTSSNLNSYADGQSLNMYNVGDVTTLTAKFVYYDANDNYKAVEKTASKDIKAVAAAADVFSKVIYTIADNNQAETWMTAKNYVALGDGLFFKAVVVFKNGNDEKKARVGKSTAVAVNGSTEPQYNGNDLVAWIPEESIAILAGAPNANGAYSIQPNTVGSTNVFIGYVNGDGSKTTVCVCPIEVRAGRYANVLTVSPSKSTLNNHGEFADSVTLNATVKDQYGDAYTTANLSTEQNTQSAGVVPVDPDALKGTNGKLGWVNNADGTYKLTINNGDVTYGTADKKGNVVLTTKLTNWDSKAAAIGVNFSVMDDGKNQNKTTDSIAFVNSGETKLDTTITGTTQFKAAKLAATTSRNGGYYTGPVGFTEVAKAPTKADTVTGPAVDFQLLIKKDGTIISGGLGNATSANDGVTVWSDFIKVNPGAGTVNVINFADKAGTIYKLPTGNYTFTLFKLTTDANKKAGEGVISSQTVVISVSDNQKAPVFEQIDETATLSKAQTGDFSECFKFSFEGTTYQPTTGFSKGNQANYTNSFFVTKCNVVVTVNVEDKTGLGLGIPGTLSKGLDCNINKLIKTVASK
ncbi:MAG: hypothetical protein J5739_03685 [Lachnospiraceae bacterium]|nr:hypothetical protein [Lachnospiraceae bacterium]